MFNKLINSSFSLYKKIYKSDEGLETLPIGFVNCGWSFYFWAYITYQYPQYEPTIIILVLSYFVISILTYLISYKLLRFEKTNENPIYAAVFFIIGIS